mgnify:CR=1 FL=1
MSKNYTHGLPHKISKSLHNNKKHSPELHVVHYSINIEDVSTKIRRKLIVYIIKKASASFTFKKYM